MLHVKINAAPAPIALVGRAAGPAVRVIGRLDAIAARAGMSVPLLHSCARRCSFAPRSGADLELGEGHHDRPLSKSHS